jgi:hypothetical protein
MSGVPECYEYSYHSTFCDFDGESRSACYIHARYGVHCSSTPTECHGNRPDIYPILRSLGGMETPVILGLCGFCLACQRSRRWYWPLLVVGWTRLTPISAIWVGPSIAGLFRVAWECRINRSGSWYRFQQTPFTLTGYRDEMTAPRHQNAA